tara:strand:+ start:6409 stop:8781 length:2373 start_codon:yes stop_codon:yes gene_type:complete
MVILLNDVIRIGMHLLEKKISSDYLLNTPLHKLMAQAAALRDFGHADRLSYSRKVFIPLTNLCRDSCSYCTFATTPSKVKTPYLLPDQVMEIARRGKEKGCKEALFTLGDKPELRYSAARDALNYLGYKSTIEYLAASCKSVIEKTGLLPHANPGVMTSKDIKLLRPVNVSMGMMLESVATGLCEPGGVHYGSPDKLPRARLKTLTLAGQARVPFTTGILIGIGERLVDRLQALLAIKKIHKKYGHIQEVIIQNFRAKPATRMADAPEPNLDDLLWTIACSRLILGSEMNIQAPPNLSPEVYPELIAAGLNDWGGISPVTPDHVNPEAGWPEIEQLAQQSAAHGKILVERLAVYPKFIREHAYWMTLEIAGKALSKCDADGLARTENWAPGKNAHRPVFKSKRKTVTPDIKNILDKTSAGHSLSENDICRLFEARDIDFDYVCKTADNIRKSAIGDTVTYVVNRNINYTNICSYQCTFCAFSKGKTHENLRGKPYMLDKNEIGRRVKEAWARGATEVCLQGGIHPEYTGKTYLEICEEVKKAAPDIHIHAFSPLEISQGAKTLGLTIEKFLLRLREVGLKSLPGTAAEILDDDVRTILCPDKLNTHEWLSIMETAHELGFHTTATIMYGHVDQSKNWARHLLRLRALQEKTMGFTEFVPLPFVHMESPIYLKGRARPGPTFREAVLMHAVARIVLHPFIRNIQVSWVKMGGAGVKACLHSGANDVGGTLMNESISRAAGTIHGQERHPEQMERMIEASGRYPKQRTTLYNAVTEDRLRISFNAAPLAATA